MMYIYYLSDRRKIKIPHYWGKTNNPSTRLDSHWNHKHELGGTESWQRGLNLWLRSLPEKPHMQVVGAMDESVVDLVEHILIVESWEKYGTDQIVNTSAGMSIDTWFQRFIRGPGFGVADGHYDIAVPTGRTKEAKRQRAAITKNMEIAAWWVEQGGKLGHNGRIPIEGLRAYRDAHNE